MKKFVTLLAIGGALTGAFYLMGMVMPRTHSVSCRATYKSDPDKVFGVFSDVEHWPQWNPMIASVQEERPEDNHPVWTLIDPKQVRTRLEIGLIDGPLKMGASFQLEGARGNLRFELKRFGDGAILRITEQRDLRSPWRRGARLFQNEYKPLMVFLESLGQRLGETVTAEAL